jgi:F-type H+-transporting ATPase subunit delta
MIDDVANAMERDERLRRFLEAPQISADQKNAVLAKAFEDRAPRLFLRYLQRLVMNRRQMLIPAIARQLTQTLGRPVVPQVRVNPNILGGIIVRVGDRVMDGSVRRRLGVLRNRMMAKAGR